MNKIGIGERIYNQLESFIMDKLVLQNSPGPVFKWIFKIPILEYKLGMGWLIGKFVLLLTTTGRKSGKLRHTPLEYIYDREHDRYRIAAGWAERPTGIEMRAPIHTLQCRWDAESSQRLPSRSRMRKWQNICWMSRSVTRAWIRFGTAGRIGRWTAPSRAMCMRRASSHPCGCARKIILQSHGTGCPVILTGTKGVCYDTKFNCDLDRRRRDCRPAGRMADRRCKRRLHWNGHHRHPRAFIGGWLFGILHISIGSGILNDIVTAFVGAAVLLLVIRMIRRI